MLLGISTAVKAHGLRIDHIINPTDGRVFRVTDLSIIANDESTVTVEFTEVDAGDGTPADYLVFKRKRGATTWNIAAPRVGTAIGATATVVVPDHDPATAYELTVRSQHHAGTLAFFSNVVEVTTDASSPAQPTNFAITSITPTAVAFSWDNVAGEDGYSIERRDVTGEGIPLESDFAEVGTTAVDVVTFIDTGPFTVDHEFEWRVIAKLGAARSAPSNTETATPAIGVPTLPGDVTDLAFVSKTDTTMTLDLTEKDNGQGSPSNYDVRHWKSSDPNPLWGNHAATTIIVTGVTIDATLQFTISGLTPNTAYQFQCVAFRGTLGVDAKFGALSNIVTQTTNTDVQVLNAPTALSPTVVDTQKVDLTFTDNATSPEEDGFVVEERNATDGGTFASIETPGPNAGTGTVVVNHDRLSAYPEDKDFEARVKATRSAASDSAFSNVVSYRPNPSAPPGDHPNEPAGFAQIFNQPFDDLPTSSSRDNPAGWRCGQGCVNFAKVSDASAPESPPNVLEGTYPTSHNTDAGHAPFDLEKNIVNIRGQGTSVAGATEVYFTWQQKLSANWQSHRRGSKVMFCWINLGPSDPDGHGGCFVQMTTTPRVPRGSSFQQHNDATMVLSIHTQGIIGRSSGGHFSNTGPAGADAILRDVWQLIEVYIKLNPTAGDETGGRLKYYLNGTLIYDAPQLWVGTGQESGFGLLYEFTPTYGGGDSDPITQAMTIRVDNIYMSGNQ